MPKIVDHDHKRKITVETAWKIIKTEGIEKAPIIKHFQRRVSSLIPLEYRAKAA